MKNSPSSQSSSPDSTLIPSESSSEPSELERGRRDHDDQTRDKAVYQYLLSLTNLEVSTSKQGRSHKKLSQPNESSIAKQWGMERIFVRRVLRSVLRDQYYPDENEQPVPGLTLGKLVKILTALQTYWDEQRATTPDRKVPRILTRAEKLRALQKFFQLSRTEREALNLPIHPADVLFQRLLEDATDPIKGISFEEAVQLYKAFLRRTALANHLTQLTESTHLDRQSIRSLIEATIDSLIQQYFNGLDGKRKSAKVAELVEKVEREISRIEFQAGIKQAEALLTKQLHSKRHEKYTDYLTPHFIQRLTRSVIENEILTDEFPIYFKYFEIEKMHPLPLYVQREGQESGLLNPQLLEPEEDQDSINGLERQFAYKVKVHFYIKLPDSYETEFPNVITIKQELGYKRLDFSEEITGIGSPLSHIIAVINRVLIWDIPILQDYLPIPDEILSNDELVGGSNHGPVWSYSLVKLYKFEDIARAIDEQITCEQVATASETAYGEFCGFDLIEVSVKAALHARLRLIQQLGVDRQRYLQELCHRIEEHGAFKRAETRLSLYPFSLRAMEGELEETIFRNRYRRREQDFQFVEHHPGKPWSVIAFEAHLKIADANLKEGLYRVAKRYLDAVTPYFRENSACFLGNAIFAKYYLCWFRYHYLSDLDDPECPYPDRYQAVRSAEESLEAAQKCLDDRLARYCKLNELPQSNFHPHFHLLARIHAHRAKLHIFFPDYTRQSGKWQSLLEPVRLLEKARICSARDGDPTLYAQWSAYQSWCYLMVAYLGEHYAIATPEFSREICIDWAKRLIDHALLCYASTGRTCYQQIKDNAGRETAYSSDSSLKTPIADDLDGQPKTIQDDGKKYYEPYGKTKVQVVPLIKELSAQDHQEQIYDPRNNILSLDMSILKDIRAKEEDSIYLFGSTSSIILFAMGMLELCQESQQAERLLHAIKHKALRMFTYCWAIASDGTRRNQAPGEADTVILDRAFAEPDEKTEASPSGDLLVRGLYPHRFTQFADLGKILVVVCKLLLVIADPSVQDYYQTKGEWEAVDPAVHKSLREITRLMSELRSNNQFPTPETLGQKRYNGHLAEHFKNMEQYFGKMIMQLKAGKLKSLNLIECRNQLLVDIFKMIRGESNILLESRQHHFLDDFT